MNLILFLFYLQSQEDLWLKAAQALTNIIKQIIEFAKMVPGFMRFNQDDQIVLLKKGKIFAIICWFIYLLAKYTVSRKVGYWSFFMSEECM